MQEKPKMFVYVLSFATGKEGNATSIDQALTAQFKTVQFQPNSWIIAHDGSIDTIRSALGVAVRPGDRFFIVQIRNRSEMALFEPYPGVDVFINLL